MAGSCDSREENDLTDINLHADEFTPKEVVGKINGVLPVESCRIGDSQKKDGCVFFHANAKMKASTDHHVSGPPPVMIERVTRGGRRLFYRIDVIQQPEKCRACGSGPKCRFNPTRLNHFCDASAHPLTLDSFYRSPPR